MCMTGTSARMTRSNKRYGWLRRQFATYIIEANRGAIRTSAAVEKMRAAKLGKKRVPHTEATKEKMRLKALGRVFTAEHCAAIAKSKLGNQHRRGR